MRELNLDFRYKNYNYKFNLPLNYLKFNFKVPKSIYNHTYYSIYILQQIYMLYPTQGLFFQDKLNSNKLN
jgi:hypothetical protein